VKPPLSEKGVSPQEAGFCDIVGCERMDVVRVDGIAIMIVVDPATAVSPDVLGTTSACSFLICWLPYIAQLNIDYRKYRVGIERSLLCGLSGNAGRGSNGWLDESCDVSDQLMMICCQA
jgi:hypothetical protein